LIASDEENPMTPDPVKPVQRPLTLILTTKSEEASRALAMLLTQQQGDPNGTLRQALDGIGTVHFARFVFLDNNTKLAVITTYDGDLETYLNAFVARIGPLFDAILEHVSPAPPLPVHDHPNEFFEFIAQHDVQAIEPFYSAYPSLTVQQIRLLAADGGG
jgi:hypothetical protein